MARLVWVTPIPPAFDAGGGGEIRQAHLLSALAERFDVHLLVAGTLTDERIRRRVGTVQELSVLAPGDPPERLRRRVRDLRWQVVQRLPDEVARHRPTRRALARAIAEGPRADLVCVEYIGLAGLLARGPAERWVLTLHNLTSEMARHNAALAPGRRQRAMRALEARNARRIERWAVEAYDLVVSPSPEDAQLLGPGVAVVPNGVDLERFQPTPLPGAPRLLFTGALHTLPNREGIQWFCQAVWPLIRARAPEARLDIAGAGPPAEVRALDRHPGVAVHPDVPDMVPFLERARVALVPLRIGTGSRLKVLEAMAAARPVVGTAIGLGGLDVLPGQDVLQADDPQSFAQAVLSVLDDDGLAGRLAQRGRARVEQSYSWAKIGREYAGLLERLV
jgi:glycosyltransferase involved in cell wall biosynthesis